MTKAINKDIPKSDVAEVQGALDALNEILPKPDLTQADVIVTFLAGTPEYRLTVQAHRRVVTKTAELVSHQLPSPTAASLPAIAPKVRSACELFGIPLDFPPTKPGDVDDMAIERP